MLNEGLRRRARLLILGWLAFQLVENVIFVRRRVLPMPPPWDPALYLFMGLRYWHVLAEHGAAALWRELQDVNLSPYAPPLFPLSALPLYFVFGESRLAAHAASSLSLCLLLLGTYLLARRRHGEGAGLVAVFLASTFSAPVNLSRDYLVDLPGAALVTLGVCCLAKSDGFRRRSGSLGFGLLAGLGLITKTMSGPFFVLPALGALVVSGRQRLGRQSVLLNLGIALAAGVLVASVWWVTHFEQAAWYVLYYGWGAGADPYEPAGSGGLFTLRSLSFYLVALANHGASVPYLLLMAGLLIHGAWRRSRPRAPSGPDAGDGTAVMLWTWFIGGYVLLSMMRNKTADRYVLFLLPPLAVLGARAIVGLPRRGWRPAVLSASVLMGLANYAALTWPRAGLALLSWSPPFALKAYRPHQAWLDMGPGLPEGEWPLLPIVTTLSSLRDATKARLVAGMMTGGQTEAPFSSPEERVRAAYRRLLRREPDPEGLRAYARELRDGVAVPTHLVQSLAASGEFAARPLRVLVVPDHPFLNVSTLRYYAEVARAPVAFDHVDLGPRGPWPLAYYDVLLVKDGGYQGPPFSTTQVPWFEAQLHAAHVGFERAASFPCPDGSQALVFVSGATEPVLNPDRY